MASPSGIVSDHSPREQSPPLTSHQELALNPTLALPAQTQPLQSNPRRLPPPCWSHDETVALIDAYREKWYSLSRGNLKANHWQEVADTVGQRCPDATPPKTAIQCRHKMEKLRKRYRTEIQRARSLPVSRFISSWVHFKRMDDMEKGSQAEPDLNSESDDDEFGDEKIREDGVGNHNRNLYVGSYKVASNSNNNYPNTKSINKLYRNGGHSVGIGENLALGSGGGGGGGGSGGFRIRIPTGVSIAQPPPAPAPLPALPKVYAKVDQRYSASPNVNSNWTPKGNFVGGSGMESGSGMGSTRVLRGSEDTGKKREREPMEEMVAAIKMLGDGFVRMEQMKMETAREIERMRMDMEMKRTEMIIDSQQRILEAFAKAFADNKKKKKLVRNPSPTS